ncbi:unnamed protein product [Caenorhabditis angaria]|uniref:RRM domain-containing protein n=1 Tax=Caenorhabditis angaria TaxID=860376 RepID=A0A9P1IA41_9PELO|nr:unnamed protein product [Caenorhabditis angaria]
MYGHQDRCDRTAYVAGLQPSISDIELFEVFNKVSHVEKVIVRNASTRHALVVFKSVEGLYLALVHFQGIVLHGRQLHIRPLRESSHKSLNENGGNQMMYDQRRRPQSVQEKFHPNSLYTYSNNRNNSSGRNGSSRRRASYNRNAQPIQHSMRDNLSPPQYLSFNNDIQFDDYSESAQRFDSLANLIRGPHPGNPYTNKPAQIPDGQKSRSNSAKECSKPAPPTWKMELQIKKENEVQQNGPAAAQVYRKNPEQPEKMTAQELLAKFSSFGTEKENSNENSKKKRPNLSVINPSLFYEQYPRTSSPLALVNTDVVDKAVSPHDPAVLAYRRARAPTIIADLSPIDIRNCSYVTKHFAENSKEMALQPTLNRREMTNEELSDMIVSTGNLRIDLPFSVIGKQSNDEPAPWSPVKRVRAESGSLSLMHINSPHFSPIKLEFDDDVFCFENNGKLVDDSPKKSGENKNDVVVDGNNVEQKLKSYQDITNSRLPSNCHSANPSSDKRSFVFPEYSPIFRHVSVPSLTNFVSDITDFGIGLHSQHVSIGEKLVCSSSSSAEVSASHSKSSLESDQKINEFVESEKPLAMI